MGLPDQDPNRSRFDSDAGVVDAALARYADNAMSCGDARTAEDITALNVLEYYRLSLLPPDHPAQQAHIALLATGWRRPEWDYTAAGSECVGLLLTEAEKTAKLAAGWRYRDCAWHPPE
ncbi:MAG: hypothetical protein WBZ37_17895 [Mycobacterium sp.]